MASNTTEVLVAENDVLFHEQIVLDYDGRYSNKDGGKIKKLVKKAVAFKKKHFTSGNKSDKARMAELTQYAELANIPPISVKGAERGVDRQALEALKFRVLYGETAMDTDASPCTFSIKITKAHLTDIRDHIKASPTTASNDGGGVLPVYCNGGKHCGHRLNLPPLDQMKRGKGLPVQCGGHVKHKVGWGKLFCAHCQKSYPFSSENIDTIFGKHTCPNPACGAEYHNGISNHWGIGFHGNLKPRPKDSVNETAKKEAADGEGAASDAKKAQKEGADGEGAASDAKKAKKEGAADGEGTTKDASASKKAFDLPMYCYGGVCGKAIVNPDAKPKRCGNRAPVDSDGHLVNWVNTVCMHCRATGAPIDHVRKLKICLDCLSELHCGITNRWSIQFH